MTEYQNYFAFEHLNIINTTNSGRDKYTTVVSLQLYDTKYFFKLNFQKY